MKKTVVIEIRFETEAPDEKIEALLQVYLEHHPILDRLPIPVLTATGWPMKAEEVKVTVKRCS